ncbi:MAG TPA: bifunctional (p)ppGpp synthetase/guanosine-3',5'-bis(diphosphate) 3'-pyrophosphohydrolase [Aggregatilinea sp.]|uniref:RelA/SpoT family protein n=1 Tax=Aggregatilinea sp. TaxID=2806333 RepID=UPI002C871732|nr:bifunctional (p)ppGpp synthetase/guanosine-3',5'-bis(diphosphate) 3'-pyrophosphohydrolase [Aggregatilinea sp.]HML22772.1 bifunctional (p)ppGpp synthetase/guanosine-3',5'-bis(diphosphate) 3'-pyrophosphohydrolase [Aggregatilinea sp.]
MQTTETLDITGILQSLPGLSIGDQALIERAFARAKIAHAGQFRKSGQPYIIHCIAVGQILADMGMDATTIAAAILHDVVEDTGVTLDDIEAEFGAKVAELVDGVTKLKQLPTGVEGMHGGKPRDREAEYLRKTFLAMGSDFRVMLIKLADRLHNMRTLGYMPPHKQIQTARETLDIFAPIANRLGIWQIKWELEDLSFRYLDPDRYREIAGQIDERRKDREAYMERVTAYIREQFARENVQAEIKGRPKHIYSIYRKMERKHLPFSQIYDIRAIRIIVDSVPECYQALGVIHNIFHSIPGEFDDYISSPKENSYRSLHTAVLDKEGKTLEVQIRTRDMDEEAEYGIAAHWRYKEGRSGSGSGESAFERRIERIRRMMEDVQQDGGEDANDFVEGMIEQITPERIYAFTPKGDIIDLPEGATPIDFAYHIHTEVGHRCRGAKVNGRLVGLDYQLKNGERVEIITANRGGPSLDWLNPDLGFTKTQRARGKIRQWFKRRDREKSIADGKEVLDRELRKLGMAQMSRPDIASQLGYATAEDLMAAIGFGDVTGAQIAFRLLDAERRAEEAAAAERLEANVTRAPEPVKADGMRIDETGGLLVTLARCCNPTHGDDIVGFITRGKGISVHRADCKNILNTNEPERIINVTWPPASEQIYPVPVLIVAYDREGLMRDIGAVIADENINMSNVNISTRHNIATFEVTMEIHDLKQLARILSKIEHLPNVVEAVRRTAV